jgi:hypothetical protein
MSKRVYLSKNASQTTRLQDTPMSIRIQLGNGVDNLSEDSSEHMPRFSYHPFLQCPTPCGYEALRSVCCPKTSWPTTNSTLICGLNICARCTGKIAPLVLCPDNGRILLANLLLSVRGGWPTVSGRLLTARSAILTPRCSPTLTYLITSSTRMRSVGGNVTPRAVACWGHRPTRPPCHRRDRHRRDC